MSFLPFQRQLGGLQYLNLKSKSKININIRKLHPKSKLFCEITCPLTSKAKPIIPVYAEVSELPPPLAQQKQEEIFFLSENKCYIGSRNK